MKIVDAAKKSAKIPGKGAFMAILPKLRPLTADAESIF
jgi:hypothetical protein